MIEKVKQAVLKKAKPTTVAEAVSGFMTALNNLRSVKETQNGIAKDATAELQRIGNVKADAEHEAHQAQAMIEKFEELLGATS